MAINRGKEFIIFPAIDLRNGKVVRLKEGDPDRQTNYSTNPGGTARQWIQSGARWIHVVNLDGAFGEPTSANERALLSIIAETAKSDVRVQFGGGLRSIESIDRAIRAGVSRVILGTLAVEQTQVLHEALARWGSEKIGVSLDSRAGRLKVRGWQNDTPHLALDVAKQLYADGLRWLVFTDIARDGLQTGVNVQATVELAQFSKLNVIASGGVGHINDVRAVEAAGLAGVIVGRALYEGTIDPTELFA